MRVRASGAPAFLRHRESRVHAPRHGGRRLTQDPARRPLMLGDASEGLRKRSRQGNAGVATKHSPEPFRPRERGCPGTGVLVETKFETGSLALRAWGRPGGLPLWGGKAGVRRWGSKPAPSHTEKIQKGPQSRGEGRRRVFHT
uniref:Uncharacterized protein n=1 Tax=Myotis myotis TaxID=51298 RepID=A0A7J7SCE2_MYOMY|nr:hypothetical protein mMyoMyo1_009466 [Myotis myotis]